MAPPTRKSPFNTPPAVMSKTGLPTAPGSRGTATALAPNTQQGDLRTVLSTVFTKASDKPQVLYNGDRLWAKIVVTLESAGPCAIGTSSDILPVLSGKGTLLDTDVPVAITIGKGTILYIAATSVNRVKLQIEPLPWLEQIAATMRDFADKFFSMFQK